MREMKKKWISFTLHVVTLFSLVACGTKSEEVEIFAAPVSGSEGQAAQCIPVQAVKEFAIKNADRGVKYRVLNAKANFVEIYGATAEEIKAEFPNARLTKNVVFHNLVPKTQSVESMSEAMIFSANKPYKGPTAPEYLAENERYLFPFLNQIGKFEVPSDVKGDNVVIAVIDTGVYYNHPELRPNIYTNDADKHGDNGNGIDDDGNGFADDYVGWDFVNGDAYPFDDQGHGTHVSGLAAGTMSGVAPNAKILPIKVLDYRGSGDLASIAAGIMYAIDRGADVINMSLGGSGIANAIQDIVSAVEVAKQNDVLVITAAGNGGNDGRGDCNDKLPVYPANITNDAIVSVASVDVNNELTSYSNYGPTTVDIAAPGGDNVYGGLLSTSLGTCASFCWNTDPYEYMSGTSMATPIVSGLAALIKSANPSLNMQQVKQIIFSSGVSAAALQGMIATGKVIDAESAIAMAQ
jgi:subtilisin family serine protease